MTTPLRVQFTVDSADPHAQADWWAETLGWSVEPTDEAFIRRMIAEGYATDEETRVYDGRLVWRTGAAIRHPDAPDGNACDRILFVQVPEPKTVKNRAHLDLRVKPDGDLDGTRDALLARGATFLWEAAEGPHGWYTMADPEGNEFCIS